MVTEIKAPVFPESVADGTIATWHKQPGEAVSRDEVICDIETDKVVLEVTLLLMAQSLQSSKTKAIQFFLTK